MDTEDAEGILADAEVVPCFQAGFADAKEVRDACLTADIPVLLDRGECCGKGGCGCAPKLMIFARSEDLPRVRDLLQERWRELARREGTLDGDEGDLPPVNAAPSASEDPPCPACGTAAPLVKGACTDCGLQLE